MSVPTMEQSRSEVEQRWVASTPFRGSGERPDQAFAQTGDRDYDVESGFGRKATNGEWI